MVRKLRGFPDQLVALVLHAGGFAVLDRSGDHPGIGAVRPGRLGDRELSTVVLGGHGDQGVAFLSRILVRRHGQGHLAGLAGFGLELEPFHRAADVPVVGGREGVGDRPLLGRHGLGVRLHADGPYGRIVGIEILFLGLVAGSGPEDRRCCSKDIDDDSVLHGNGI